MWRNSGSNTRLRLASAGLLAALALPAGAGPAGVTLPFETAQVGQGTLRFLGLRIWHFYLAYCEAGFRAGSIDVAQFRLEHAA